MLLKIVMSLIKLRPGSPKILKSAQKIHQNIKAEYDSKLTLGIDKVLEGLKQNKWIRLKI